jgi:hypothetical protein
MDLVARAAWIVIHERGEPKHRSRLWWHWILIKPEPAHLTDDLGLALALQSVVQFRSVLLKVAHSLLLGVRGQGLSYDRHMVFAVGAVDPLPRRYDEKLLKAVV